MRNLILAILIIAAFTASAHAGWFGGPKDYNECLLENLKGVKSDKAAIMIARACSEKFPDQNDSDSGQKTAEVQRKGNFFDQFDEPRK